MHTGVCLHSEWGLGDQHLWFPLKARGIDFLNRGRALTHTHGFTDTLHLFRSYISKICLPSLPVAPSSSSFILGDLYWGPDNWSLFSGPPGKADNAKVCHQFCPAFTALPRLPFPPLRAAPMLFLWTHSLKLHFLFVLFVWWIHKQPHEAYVVRKWLQFTTGGRGPLRLLSGG